MGQKVNPHGLRVGIIKDWDAKWYAEKDFADYLVEDVKIRKFIKKKLYDSGISKISIERTADRVKITYTQQNPVLLSVRTVQPSKHLKAELQKMTARRLLSTSKKSRDPNWMHSW